jgi:dCTP deaminase
MTFNGMSFGLSIAGYDVRVAQEVEIKSGHFQLASTVEEFNIPNNILAKVADKSTLARRGMSVFNTIIEPGWKGFLTVEMVNHGRHTIHLPAGCPVAQIIFHVLSEPAERPYDGKYQHQPNMPVEAIHEGLSLTKAEVDAAILEDLEAAQCLRYPYSGA